MISVIIPTYNRAALLKKSIESVLAQTLPCNEIIVVDDGSTDDTCQVVKKIAVQNDNVIRYFFQRNKGAAAARNKGIREAAYDTLCFLDSDDSFVPEKVKQQYAAMLRTPQYLISHTREIWYRRGVLLKQKKKHQPPHGEIFKRCLEMCVIGMSTVMVRRKIFDRFGYFDENFICCEDYDFWLRVSAAEKFLLVDMPLTVKDGGRHDQLSVIYRIGMDKYRISSILNLLEKQHLSSEQFHWAVDELIRKTKVYGEGCLKYGREDEANFYLDLPLRFTPFKNY